MASQKFLLQHGNSIIDQKYSVLFQVAVYFAIYCHLSSLQNTQKYLRSSGFTIGTILKSQTQSTEAELIMPLLLFEVLSTHPH